jgi:hypothetical protein
MEMKGVGSNNVRLAHSKREHAAHARLASNLQRTEKTN